MSDCLEIDVTFEDEEPLAVADRATALPGFDLALYAVEAMVDDEWEEPTLEVAEESLTELVSKSVPPSLGADLDQFAQVTIPPSGLLPRKFSPVATHLISLIDGQTPLAVVLMNSGLTHSEAMSGLRELYAESIISMVA